MKTKYISPFRPKKYIKLKPQNIQIYTLNAGFKKYNDDLLVIIFEKPVKTSGVYSKTSTPSAPIIWDKSLKENLCKILIVNSGNANAFTGSLGLESIKKYTKAASTLFKCNQNQIYVSSTGVIGEQLNSNNIIKKINDVKFLSRQNIYKAAKAIMTTDTFPKVAHQILKYNKNKIRIYGFAKGSGMIAPQMGTMLAYIFIEAPLSKIDLKRILINNIEDTFNSISVDGDTSTSDTVLLFSTENENKNFKINKKLITMINFKVKEVMLNLAKQIVCDGEGISKLIEVNVKNAKSKSQAKKIAFSIAESTLVKTAIFGNDANWGRIIMAIGKSFEKLNQNKFLLKIGNMTVAEKGMMSKKINIRKLDQFMKNKIIKINLDLSLGKENKTVWSSDLSYKYVEINADYRS